MSHEAWWDPDLIAREKWQDAICLEFKKMLDMGVGDMLIEKTVHKAKDWLGVDGYLR